MYAFWAVGSMVDEAMKSAAALEEDGISAGVVNMRFVKPLDSELLVKTAQQYKNIVNYGRRLFKRRRRQRRTGSA